MADVQCNRALDVMELGVRKNKQIVLHRPRLQLNRIIFRLIIIANKTRRQIKISFAIKTE